MSAPTPGQRTIVIAEDEPRILRSLAFIVEREGGRAVGCEDGQQALDAIRRERPVLAIIDVMMPQLDGLAVTRAVRGDPHLAGLPIVILTALGQADHERQALEAGATRYIRKPFDPRALRELIVGYLAA
jgi:DNA-binding response OmpR family regulator